LEIKYSNKANVVADALCRKPKGMIASLHTTNAHLVRELEALQIVVVLPTERAQLIALQVTSPIVCKIKDFLKSDPELRKLIKKVEEEAN